MKRSIIMKIRNITVFAVAVIVMVYVVFLFMDTKALPKKDCTDYLYIQNYKPAIGTNDPLKRLVRIQDGMNMHGTDLSHAKINHSFGKLKNANFTWANLDNADLGETVFVDCSFRNAKLGNVEALDAEFINCDFSEADIAEIKNLRINVKDLKKTISYHQYKSLRKCDLRLQIDDAHETLDLSGFNLIESNISVRLNGKDYADIILTGARIKRARLDLPGELIFSTSDFQNKTLVGNLFRDACFENKDLSHFLMYDCSFRNCDFKHANLTDASLTKCELSDAKNLTIEQIKSTWSYKSGRRDWQAIPKDIQQQLDAENITK